MQSKELSKGLCLLDPIPEIYEAAFYLDEAVVAHLGGHSDLAYELIRRADMPAIGDRTESLWGKKWSAKGKASKTLVAPLTEDASPRNPDEAMKRSLLERDGHHCRFCGIPVIREKVRTAIQKAYPNALRWAPGNANQHFGFQAMWVAYDHVIPWSKGGTTTLENMVVTCAPCNCARMEDTLEEVGLMDPRKREPVRSSWNGLENFR